LPPFFSTSQQTIYLASQASPFTASQIYVRTNTLYLNALLPIHKYRGKKKDQGQE
jgi:hypothetical protein